MALFPLASTMSAKQWLYTWSKTAYADALLLDLRENGSVDPLRSRCEALFFLTKCLYT